jgi:hypothetical protein
MAVFGQLPPLYGSHALPASPATQQYWVLVVHDVLPQGTVPGSHGAPPSGARHVEPPLLLAPPPSPAGPPSPLPELLVVAPELPLLPLPGPPSSPAVPPLDVPDTPPLAPPLLPNCPPLLEPASFSFVFELPVPPQ